MRIFVMAITAIISLAVFACLFYIEYHAPDIAVQHWKDISDYGKSEILKMIELDDNEGIQYYYGAGALSYQEDGNVVTNFRLISYLHYEGEDYLSSAYYGDIQRIKIDYSESWLEDTMISVHHKDPDLDFDLLFSTDKEMDQEVIDYIDQRLFESKRVTQSVVEQGVSDQ